MAIWLTKEFARLAQKSRLRDQQLLEAVSRAEQGLIDAQIGRHLIKQRVARTGEGRSGGFRTIVYLRAGSRAVYLHLYAKNESANLTPAEQAAYKDYAGLLDELDDEAFARLVRQRGWREIENAKPKDDISK